jgi:hypothetical protein
VIEGAVIALVSLAIGYLTGRKAKRPTIEKSKPATCGCGHVRSMHVDGRGKCMYAKGTEYWETDPDTGFSVKKFRDYQCDCQIYDGPEPLTTIYAPEITP